MLASRDEHLHSDRRKRQRRERGRRKSREEREREGGRGESENGERERGEREGEIETTSPDGQSQTDSDNLSTTSGSLLFRIYNSN